MRDRYHLSVIIPTHNRVEDLGRLLAYLLESLHQSDAIEVIVVANACTHDTSVLVQAFVDKFREISVRLVDEPRLGLHYARHKGALAARADLLMFTDDDALFSFDALAAYMFAFRENPQLGAAGGPVVPEWVSPPPSWLLAFMGNSESFGILSLRNRGNRFIMGTKMDFYGVNMAIRRQILFELGGFNPECYGDIWLGDGETGLMRKLWKHNVLVGYVPNAVVRHVIPQRRMTVGYFRHRMANEGACDIYAKYHEGGIGRRRLFYDCLREVKSGLGLWCLGAILYGQKRSSFLTIQMKASRSYRRFHYMIILLFSAEMRKLVLRKNWLSDSPV